MVFDEGAREAVGAAVVVEPGETSGEAPGKVEQPGVIPPADVRHNMIVLIMLEAIFNTGSADLGLVLVPLFVFLNASNTLMGLVMSLAPLALIGIISSPFISVRCRVKKWYLLFSHVPYIGTWGILGLVLVFSAHLGLSKPSLLAFLVAMQCANFFFGGFVQLPHQEYVAACIPMSHRGRYNGYSLTAGAIASMASNAVGGLILLRVARPAAFGYLYLMAWFLCQAGYVMALFGRERPTPVEKAPKPWSKAMLAAAWKDKAYLRVIVLYQVFNMIYIPLFTLFLLAYGMKELKMIPATAAVVGMIMLLARMSASSLIGHTTDRFSPKRVLPVYPLIGLLAFLPLFILRNQWGIYASVAVFSVFSTGYQNAFGTLIYGIPSPENRSGHYTLQLLLNSGTSGIGAITLGVMFDRLSYMPTFAIFAVVTLALAPITRRLLSILSADPRDYA